MNGLERHRGHFFNWYDTHTLKPLPPSYVSSVDSGNLSGHLLTLSPGLRELKDHSILGSRAIEGLVDTLGLLLDAAGEDATAELSGLRDRVESASRSRPGTAAAARIWLEGLVGSARVLAGRFTAEASGTPEAGVWARALAAQIEDLLSDLDFVAPHAALGEPPGRLREVRGLGAVPTLRELSAVEGAFGESPAAAPDEGGGSAERASRRSVRFSGLRASARPRGSGSSTTWPIRQRASPRSTTTFSTTPLAIS